MMRNLMLLSCAAAMSFSASIAAADGYVGASIGSAGVDDPQGGVDDSDTGFKLFGGYRFNENWAVEGFYADFGAPESTTFGIPASTEITGIGAQIVGAFPVSDQIELFVNLGFISWEEDFSVLGIVAGSDDGEDLTYGIGVTFNVSEQVSIRGGWEFYDIADAFGDIDVDLLSVGVEFSF